MDTGEIVTAVIVAGALIATNLATWGMKKIADYVKGTPNKIDDKIFEAVRKAVAAGTQDKDPR